MIKIHNLNKDVYLQNMVFCQDYKIIVLEGVRTHQNGSDQTLNVISDWSWQITG